MVEPLEPGDVVPTAAVLAAAFEVDAAYRTLFPGPERPAGLRELFTRNLRIHLPHRCTWVARDAGSVVATLTVRPPHGFGISLWTMFRHGALPFALTHGARVTRRLLWLKSTYDRLEAEAAGQAPHWHLHMMAVQPAHQGTGLGTRVLDEVLARTVGAGPAHPVVLTTHSERNLAFYRRAGFEVCGDRALDPPDGAPYRVWSMRL